MVMVPSAARNVGAFRGWPDGIHGQAWHAEMESPGHASVRAAVAQALQFGLIKPGCGEPCHCHAVLDVENEDGDPIDDWCIPTPEAFKRLAAMVNLRCAAWDVLGPNAGLDEPDVLALVTPDDVARPVAAS